MVRWEESRDEDDEIWRPTDFSDLLDKLQAASLYTGASDVLYYFPRDIVQLSNRVKLTEASFAEWESLDLSLARLPRIWVYPRADGGSPEKPPARAAEASPKREDDSAVTPSEQRLTREKAFKDILRTMDGERCLFPGCPVHNLSGSASVVEAAHIIPRYILNIRKYNTSELYNSILKTAEFSRLDIDTPSNRMLLCSNHHAAFDSFQWTVDPPSGTILCRSGKIAATLGYKKGGKLDFSHRMGRQRPPQSVWTSYYNHVYDDFGKALKKAANYKEAES